MAERTCLLNKRTLNGVPGVRIPVSPQLQIKRDLWDGFFFCLLKLFVESPTVIRPSTFSAHKPSLSLHERCSLFRLSAIANQTRFVGWIFFLFIEIICRESDGDSSFDLFGSQAES